MVVNSVLFYFPPTKWAPLPLWCQSCHPHRMSGYMHLQVGLFFPAKSNFVYQLWLTQLPPERGPNISMAYTYRNYKPTLVPKNVYLDALGSIGPYNSTVRRKRLLPGIKRSKCICSYEKKNVGSKQYPIYLRVFQLNPAGTLVRLFREH